MQCWFGVNDFTGCLYGCYRYGGYRRYQAIQAIMILLFRVLQMLLLIKMPVGSFTGGIVGEGMSINGDSMGGKGGVRCIR